MSTFKIKHDKNKHRVHVSTLDETHKKIMNDFERNRSSLPKKKKKLQLLEKQLTDLEQRNPNEYSNEDIKLRAELKTSISDLKDVIYDIENDVSELEYYFKTEDIIMDYYEIIEMGDHELYEHHPELGEIKKNQEEKEIGILDKLNKINLEKKKKTKIAKKRKRIKPQQNSSILDFMGNVNQNNTNEPIEYETETETETEIIVKSPSTTDNSGIDKAKLLDQYMILIDKNYFAEKGKENIIKMCNNCNIEKTLIHAEGMFVCPTCGEAEMIIIDSEKPNYKEALNDSKPSYPYKKSNHLSLYVFRALKTHKYIILCSLH